MGALITKHKAVDALGEGIGRVVSALLKLLKAALPTAYGSGSLSLLRGNLAVIFAHLATLQQSEEVRPVSEVDLKPAVSPLLEYLRKETGPVQQNCGIAVTQL